MGLETQQGVEELGAATKTMGTAIRGMFNAIGNSTVTAATVIGLALIICTGMLIASGADSSAAQERRHIANARYVEILNDKATGVAVVGIFGAIVPIPDTDQISIKLRAVTNVTEYRIKWYISTRQGLETFVAPVADVDGNITLTIPKEAFGAGWSLDARIMCQIFATDITGRTIKSEIIPVWVDQSRGE